MVREQVDGHSGVSHWFWTLHTDIMKYFLTFYILNAISPGQEDRLSNQITIMNVIVATQINIAVAVFYKGMSLLHTFSSKYNQAVTGYC